jgi:hypothetical protein
MKNLANFCVTSSILALVVLGLLVESCKKSAPPSQPAAETEKSTEAVTSEPNKADANATKMVPLDINLPHSAYRGTEFDVRVPYLDTSTKLREDFYAPEGVANVALGKPVVSNQEPIIGDMTIITDGDKEAADGSFVEFGPGITYVTIDLKEHYNIYAIVVWHYHQHQQAYFDVIVQVSNDPDFINDVQVLFNNDRDNSAGQGIGSDMHYIDTHEGKLIDAKGVKARYVRLYSNGNSMNELNHYTEVEVYGKPTE